MVHWRWEDETARETTGQQPSYSEAKQTKSLTLRMATNGVILLFCLLLFHSFIHSGYFYSTSSSPLLLIGAPAQHGYGVGISRRSVTGKKDLPKVPMRQLERESNP